MVVDNSLACIGAMRALMDAGLQPGRDLSVIAQDFVSEADLLVMPSITSIEHADAQRVGAQLADLVIGVQQKRPLSAELQVLWQPSIRPGATATAPRLQLEPAQPHCPLPAALPWGPAAAPSAIDLVPPRPSLKAPASCHPTPLPCAAPALPPAPSSWRWA